MTLQTTVNIYNAAGVPGDVAFSGPMRAQPANINSGGAETNYIGYAYTYTGNANPDTTAGSPNASTAQVGGTGVFAGVLINSKEYAAYGNSSGPLNPVLYLPDNTMGDLCFMGEVWVEIPGPANIGDLVYFDQTTGALGSMAATATGTATQSGTTLTVATATTGNLGVGSVLNLGSGNEAVTILELGSGTGGTGTYTVNVSQSIASPAAYTANSAVPSGKTLIPHGEISRFGVSAVSPTGLAVLKMTN